jgi:NitT/TauT family transport system ATP-binding protein
MIDSEANVEARLQTTAGPAAESRAKPWTEPAAQPRAEPSPQSPFRLVNVSRSYGATEVLRDLNLEIRRGEFVAVVGPSGSGKTTLLNLLSGFDQPTSGTLLRHGTVRTVYQQDGLFPWLTVRENLALGLRHLRTAGERERSVQEFLGLIRMEDFAGFYPHQLSVGMKQRVEIGRALASEASTLLMDEPFSALDCLTRLRMRCELMRMLEQRPRTVVFVTHDVVEAAHLADRVVVFTSPPTSIRCELELRLPQPRELTHPVVVDAVRKILDGLDFQSGRVL